MISKRSKSEIDISPASPSRDNGPAFENERKTLSIPAPGRIIFANFLLNYRSSGSGPTSQNTSYISGFPDISNSHRDFPAQQGILL
jgi:hypothetical protein